MAGDFRDFDAAAADFLPPRDVRPAQGVRAETGEVKPYGVSGALQRLSARRSSSAAAWGRSHGGRQKRPGPLCWSLAIQSRQRSARPPSASVRLLLSIFGTSMSPWQFALDDLDCPFFQACLIIRPVTSEMRMPARGSLANEEIAFFVEAAQHERLLFGEDALLAHILILRQLVLGPPPTTPLSTTGTCQLEKTENCIRRTGFRTTRAVRSERRINLEGELQRTSVRQCCQQHCWKVGNKRNGSPVWTRFELSPPS